VTVNSGGERLLSPEDVACRCRLSRRAVYRAIERGELPASRLCSRLRIRPQDLDAWISANRVESSGLPELAASTTARRSMATNGLRRLLIPASDEEAEQR